MASAKRAATGFGIRRFEALKRATGNHRTVGKALSSIDWKSDYSVALSGLVSYLWLFQGRRASRLPLATFCRAAGAHLSLVRKK